MRSSAEHLRTQREERRMKIQGFLTVKPNPFVDEVAIVAVAQGDVCDGGTGLVALWALKIYFRFGAEHAWKIRLMGQKWCQLIGGHHGLRRLRQEDVLAGRIPGFDYQGQGSVSFLCAGRKPPCLTRSRGTSIPAECFQMAYPARCHAQDPHAQDRK